MGGLAVVGLRTSHDAVRARPGVDRPLVDQAVRDTGLEAGPSTGGPLLARGAVDVLVRGDEGPRGRGAR